MSFLAGRLAGQEGAYFFQETKQLVSRMVEKKVAVHSPTPHCAVAASTEIKSSADVLPEVLRHSIPSKLYYQQPPVTDPSVSLTSASKWSLNSGSGPNSSSISSDALNPFRAYLSMPQVTFGPKRWQLPQSGGSVTASTANELRRDQYTHVSPEKLKASAEGLKQIAKAFFIATTIIFGGGSLMFGIAVSKLQVQNSDDLKNKGRDLLHPKMESFREQLAPLRSWVESTSEKWYLETNHELREKPMIQELSKMLGAKR